VTFTVDKTYIHTIQQQTIFKERISSHKFQSQAYFERIGLCRNLFQKQQVKLKKLQPTQFQVFTAWLK